MDGLYFRRRGLIAATATMLIGAALPARAADPEAAVIEPIRQLVALVNSTGSLGTGRFDSAAWSA